MTPLQPTHHQPYFCEENIWWLNQHPKLVGFERFAVFITNSNRSVALASQKAGGRDGVVIWDYHVILAVLESEWVIYDLDTTAGIRQPMDAWFSNSIGLFKTLPSQFVAGYRAIRSDIFHSCFSSDRHHMKNPDGSWMQTPPSWPPIGHGHTLSDFVDPTNDTYGELLTEEGFKTRVTTRGHRP